MTFGFTQVAEYWFIGWALALTFCVLRFAIDRRKGALIEVAAVTTPIAFAAFWFFFILPPGRIGYGDAISMIVQAVFMALPVLVAFRFLERLEVDEQIQLVDLFRITTVASLVAFVFTSLVISENAPLMLVCLCVFVLNEWVANSRTTSIESESTRWALVFAGSYIIASLLCIGCGIRLTNVQPPRVWTLISSAAISESAAIVGLLLPQTIAAHAIELLLLRTEWFARLAVWMARSRQEIGKPRDLIYVRTVFDLWRFSKGVVFLNHGSFGAVPITLRNMQRSIREKCENEPMDFLARRLEPLWFEARFKLAVWLGSPPENIAFCENATAGMNEIANWFPLAKGDEVLLNDHEYGAVRRIWQRRCEETGATLVCVKLPMPFTDPQQITDAILGGCNERTRLVVVSHITSPTAVILPVAEICKRLRERNIASCIDGPHALLQEKFKLYSLNCDFYTASCHKWLCAPLGSGFVYVDPRWHDRFQPARLSWGRLNPNKPTVWSDELLWTGTRDPSAYLTVPHAIEYFTKFDRDNLDARNHELACYAWRRLSEIPGAEPVTPEGREWFGWMVGVWLPTNYAHYATLQQRLWERYRIEVPIVHFGDRYLVRVSCPLYITSHDIDTLVRCLQRELANA